MSQFWRVFQKLAKRHDVITSVGEEECSSPDLHRTLVEHSSLWQTVEGLPLSCGGLALELVICCSLVQLELFLYLTQNSISSADNIAQHLARLTRRLSVHLCVSSDEEQVYSAISERHANDFIGHTLSHVYTVVALVDLMSSSSHEQGSRRLALAHRLLSPNDHKLCKDWFQCLLKVRAILVNNEDRTAQDYFEGWWSGCSISSTSDLAFLWNGTCFAQKGCHYLALCKYRQCLLQHGSSACTVAALTNCALVFHKLCNICTELDIRLLLLKALQSAPPKSSPAMVWRRDGYISTNSGVYDQLQLRKSACSCAQRALLSGRPKLAVSLLEGMSDLLSLPGIGSGCAPGLMLLRSLLEIEREYDALDVCLKIITSMDGSSHLLHSPTGLQLAETLLLGSMAALKLNQYELAFLLAGRCYGLSTLFSSGAGPASTQHCLELMQQSQLVLSVLLVGAGKFSSALSLLTFAKVGGDPSCAVDYNLTLLKIKLAQQGQNEHTLQSLLPLLKSFPSTECAS